MDCMFDDRLLDFDEEINPLMSSHVDLSMPLSMQQLV